jgi:hypothetical protein
MLSYSNFSPENIHDRNCDSDSEKPLIVPRPADAHR